MNNMEEDTIDLLELARAIWKNILAIALVAVLFGSAAFGVTAFVIEPKYQATAALYVNNSSFSLGSTSFSISGALRFQQPGFRVYLHSGIPDHYGGRDQAGGPDLYP